MGQGNFESSLAGQNLSLVLSPMSLDKQGLNGAGAGSDLVGHLPGG